MKQGSAGVFLQVSAGERARTWPQGVGPTRGNQGKPHTLHRWTLFETGNQWFSIGFWYLYLGGIDLTIIETDFWMEILI